MAEGLFGSNVGGKAAQRPKPLTTPAVKPPKLAAPHFVKAPTVHVSALHPHSVPGLPHQTASSMKVSWTKPVSYTLPVKSSGGGSVLGSIAGGVEGFIGHLGSDVVHTAMGLPVGIAYMVQHPIAAVEQSAKLTWQDWSPLFHGQYRTWAHNFYEHPLAPILDVASVVTLGGSAAGRGAEAVGRLGAAVTGAEDASVTASARVAGRFVSAAKAGKAAGEIGTRPSTLWGKLQKFGNPTKYAGDSYGRAADKLGFGNTPEARARFIQEAMNADGQARKVTSSAGGITKYDSMNRNPMIRARERAVGKVTNSVAKSGAGQKLRLDKVIGDEAAFKRWVHMDRGARRAAMGDRIRRELVGIHKMGQLLTELKPHEGAALMEPTMREGLLLQAHAVEPQADLAAQAQALDAEHFQFVANDAHRGPLMEAAYKKLQKEGEQGLQGFFTEAWPKANTTLDPAKAATDAQGRLLVVSQPDAIAKDGFFGGQVAKLLYEKPTQVWRYMLLGVSPRYFVNNFVGNTIMLMAATDPVSTAKGFFDYMRTLHGSNVEWKAMVKEMEKKGATAADIQKAALLRDLKGKHWMDQFYAGEYGFAGSNRIDPVTGKPEGGLLHRAPNLHGITHRVADMPQRYMAMNYTMKRIPEYQQAYAAARAQGLSHFKADQEAATFASRSPAVRQLVRQQVHHMLGQYHTFAKWERATRHIVPFYAWDRAIVHHMQYLVRSQPYKVAMGAALGTLGHIKTQQLLGNVPDFLLSAIPAKLLSGPLSPLKDLIGGNKNGRTGILNALSLSPYGTVGDLANLAMAATGQGKLRAGETLGGQLNPIIQGAAQELTGTDMMTGTPTKGSKFGPIAGMYLDAFGTIPQETLLKALIGQEGSSTTKKGNPTLYEKNVQAPLSSFLGLPIRQVSKNTAHALGRLQNGQKTSHPRTRKLNFPGL